MTNAMKRSTVILLSSVVFPTLAAGIDLDGTWQSEYGAVCIKQAGSSVVAKFITPFPCKNGGGALSEYFSGTLTEAALTGSINDCQPPNIVEECKVPFSYHADYTASVTAERIRGTFTQEGFTWKYYDADRSCEGKHLDPPFDKKLNFTLTRKALTTDELSAARRAGVACGCDKEKACAGLAKAAQAAIEAASQPASSFGAVKESISSQLSQIRNQVCDNDAAIKQLDDIAKSLDSLSGSSPRQAQQMKLAGISDDLDVLRVASCGQVSKSDCASGEKKADSGDEKAAEFVKDKFKETLDKVKEAAREMQDRGATIPQQMKDQIKNLQKAVAFWSQIKAASCVPTDVLQTMQQVASDRNAEGHSENCPAMCSALRNWYQKLIGQSNSLQGKLFMEDCLARCN
jgi:hypothetical protein